MALSLRVVLEGLLILLLGEVYTYISTLSSAPNRGSMHGGSMHVVGMKILASSFPVRITKPAAAHMKICHFKPIAA
jgi:hypothetical protein